MSKKSKPAPLPVTPETIDKAAETGTIKSLVELSDAFYRAGIHGPFEVELPLFTSMFIGAPKNQYRRGNVTIGTRFSTEAVSLGKKAGLIFAFKPVAPLDRNGEPVERIEMSWDDVINSFSDLATRIEAELGGKLVADMNVALKAAIDRNPSMHKILSEGFALAQKRSREDAGDEQLSQIEGFGSF